MKRNSQACFVVEKDCQIIASILVENNGRRAYIYHLAVSPLFQHQGIGTQLGHHTLNQLKDLDIHKVVGVIFEKHQNTQLFWENIDFVLRDD